MDDSLLVVKEEEDRKRRFLEELTRDDERRTCAELALLEFKRPLKAEAKPSEDSPPPRFLATSHDSRMGDSRKVSDGNHLLPGGPSARPQNRECAMMKSLRDDYEPLKMDGDIERGKKATGWRLGHEQSTVEWWKKKAAESGWLSSLQRQIQQRTKN